MIECVTFVFVWYEKQMGCKKSSVAVCRNKNITKIKTISRWIFGRWLDPFDVEQCKFVMPWMDLFMFVLYSYFIVVIVTVWNGWCEIIVCLCGKSIETNALNLFFSEFYHENMWCANGGLVHEQFFLSKWDIETIYQFNLFGIWFSFFFGKWIFNMKFSQHFGGRLICGSNFFVWMLVFVCFCFCWILVRISIKLKTDQSRLCEFRLSGID